jgi:hypothetical protein
MAVRRLTLLQLPMLHLLPMPRRRRIRLPLHGSRLHMFRHRLLTLLHRAQPPLPILRHPALLLPRTSRHNLTSQLRTRHLKLAWPRMQNQHSARRHSHTLASRRRRDVQNHRQGTWANRRTRANHSTWLAQNQADPKLKDVCRMKQLDKIWPQQDQIDRDRNKRTHKWHRMRWQSRKIERVEHQPESKRMGCHWKKKHTYHQ